MNNPWKDVIMEELLNCHIYIDGHEEDPKRALDDLIAWHTEVAIYFHEHGKKSA